MSDGEKDQNRIAELEGDKAILCNALRSVIKKSFLVSLDVIDLANQLQLMVIDAKTALKEVKENY